MRGRMKCQFVLALSGLLLVGVLSGCATLADARYARGQGVQRTYNADFETVWRAVPQALSSLGLSVAGDNKKEGYYLAQRGITAFSYGEHVAVFVESAGENQTKVEVVSKKAMATNIFAPDWAPEVLQRLNQMLKL